MPRITVTAADLYVAWQVSRPGSVVRSERARVDAASGRVEAARPLGAAFEQAVLAAGALWVAASTGSSAAVQMLVRLNPDTLTLTGRWQVGTGGGRGAVQRRDPVTGALEASYPVMGVSAPAVAGPFGSVVWVSEATGMMGYVQRLEAATMTAAGSACTEGGTTSTCVEGTNNVTARLAGGLLWITQMAGGQARNYCADPVTGRKIAPIALPQPAQDEVLAITAHQIFYAAPGPGANQYLRHEPIPNACRTF